MAKGKRPAQNPSPWGRWAAVIVGLVIVGGIVWWVAGSSPEDEAAAPADTAAQEGGGPRPLDVSGPTVEEAATLDVPDDSLVAAGPDAERGVNISNDPRTGSASAPVTIVEFSDFECPFCGRFHRETYPALQRLYGDRIRWVFLNNPVSGHEWGRPAALAGECATRQGRFWEFADYVFEHQEDLSGDFLRQEVPQAIGVDAEAYLACLNGQETASEVSADLAEGDRVGVIATPTFFVNGIKIQGAQPVGVFNEVLAPYFSR